MGKKENANLVVPIEKKLTDTQLVSQKKKPPFELLTWPTK